MELFQRLLSSKQRGGILVLGCLLLLVCAQVFVSTTLHPQQYNHQSSSSERSLHVKKRLGAATPNLPTTRNLQQTNTLDNAKPNLKKKANLSKANNNLPKSLNAKSNLPKEANLKKKANLNNKTPLSNYQEPDDSVPGPDVPHIQPPTSHKVTTSVHSGRRFLASVLSLPSDVDRRNSFYPKWQAAWPDLNIVHQPTFMTADAVKGYGCLAGDVLAMAGALLFANETGQEFDYFLILEDDSVPYVEGTWPSATENKMNDLDLMLDQVEGEGGGIIFLGCHRVGSPERDQLHETGPKPNQRVAHVTKSYGSYAMMISRKHLEAVYNSFTKFLEAKVGQEYPSDVSIHYYFQTKTINEFVAVPLMVSHESTTSHTEHKTYKKHPSWEGHRDWWNQEIPASRGAHSMEKWIQRDGIQIARRKLHVEEVQI